MEPRPTSLNTTPDREVDLVSPFRAVSASSALLLFLSFGALRLARPDSFLFGISLGFFIVSCLPLLVALRRCLWGRRFSGRGRWMAAVTGLLWASLLIGPLVTGAFGMWTHYSVPPDGMARPSNFVGLAVFGVVSFSAAYFLAVLTFFIQLWGDQWHTKLTSVSIVFLFLLFVIYLRLHT